jgi:hypothetical protein
MPKTSFKPQQWKKTKPNKTKNLRTIIVLKYCRDQERTKPKQRKKNACVHLLLKTIFFNWQQIINGYTYREQSDMM